MRSKNRIYNFIFSDKELINLKNKSRAVCLKKNICSYDQLFSELKHEFKLPMYMQYNWNALLDYLADLSWIREKNILLIHTDLPDIDNINLISYLEVLLSTAYDWKYDEDHNFYVYFPDHLQNKIESMLKEELARRKQYNMN